MDHLTWYVSRAAGMTCWLLLAVSLLLGLAVASGAFRTRRPELADVHAFAGGLSLLFLVVHAGALLLDKAVPFGLRELLVPLASPYRPRAVAAGVVAGYLLLAVLLTSWARRWLPSSLWRAVHLTTPVAFALGGAHAWTTGTDEFLVRGTAGGVALAAVFAGSFRMLTREAAPSPASLPLSYPLVVREVRPESCDAVSVALDVPAEYLELFRFAPGQYLVVEVELPDGQLARRPYSIVSALADGELRIAVKEVPDGRVSPVLTRTLRPGQVLNVSPPSGSFAISPHPLRSRHVLGVAAGSGITPVLSVLKSLLLLEPRSRATLVYGNRTLDDALFLTDLQDLQRRYGDRLTVHHVLSREPGAALPGRIRPDLLAQLLPEGADEVFVCGPSELCSTLGTALPVLGFGTVHLEGFGATAAGGATRTVSVGGRPVQVSAGATVLQACERAGITVPSSCRAGSCGACVLPLRSGRLDISGRVVTGGRVATCIARPVDDTAALGAPAGSSQDSGAHHPAHSSTLVK